MPGEAQLDAQWIESAGAIVSKCHRIVTFRWWIVFAVMREAS